MNCKEVTELISEYLDGKLGVADRREFESHLDTCRACASEVASTKEMLSSLRSLANQKSPVDVWQRVRAEVTTKEAKRGLWWRWVLRPVVAAPALAAAAAIAALLAWPSGDVPMASDKQFAPEYRNYIGAHSHALRQEAFADPDVVFVGAEVEKASLVEDSGQ